MVNMTSDRINVKQYYISVFTYVARTRNTKTKTHVDTNTRICSIRITRTDGT